MGRGPANCHLVPRAATAASVCQTALQSLRRVACVREFVYVYQWLCAVMECTRSKLWNNANVFTQALNKLLKLVKKDRKTNRGIKVSYVYLRQRGRWL